MAPQAITRKGKATLRENLDQQGANAMLVATFEFLRRNQIGTKLIIDFAKNYRRRHKRDLSLRLYNEFVRTYDDIGVIMATWFSDPKFLDQLGNPVPLSQERGPNTVAKLIRASGARVRSSVAVELMRQSPSIKIDRDGRIFALRRVFVLPGFEVPRAAFVVERYLETVQRNDLGRERETPPLLERSCYVSKVDLATIAPMLRNIDGRGTAFMDSLDGEIEGLRLRRSKRKHTGELGVLLFAWTGPAASKKHRKQNGSVGARQQS